MKISWHPSRKAISEALAWSLLIIYLINVPIPEWVRAPTSQMHRFARQTRQGDQPQWATYFFEIYEIYASAHCKKWYARRVKKKPWNFYQLAQRGDETR